MCVDITISDNAVQAQAKEERSSTTSAQQFTIAPPFPGHRRNGKETNVCKPLSPTVRSLTTSARVAIVSLLCSFHLTNRHSMDREMSSVRRDKERLNIFRDEMILWGRRTQRNDRPSLDPKKNRWNLFKECAWKNQQQLQFFLCCGTTTTADILCAKFRLGIPILSSEDKSTLFIRQNPWPDHFIASHQRPSFV